MRQEQKGQNTCFEELTFTSRPYVFTMPKIQSTCSHTHSLVTVQPMWAGVEEVAA